MVLLHQIHNCEFQPGSTALFVFICLLVCYFVCLFVFNVASNSQFQPGFVCGKYERGRAQMPHTALSADAGRQSQIQIQAQTQTIIQSQTQTQIQAQIQTPGDHHQWLSPREKENEKTEVDAAQAQHGNMPLPQ